MNSSPLRAAEVFQRSDREKAKRPSIKRRFATTARSATLRRLIVWQRQTLRENSATPRLDSKPIFGPRKTSCVATATPPNTSTQRSASSSKPCRRPTNSNPSVRDDHRNSFSTGQLHLEHLQFAQWAVQAAQVSQSHPAAHSAAAVRLHSCSNEGSSP